MSNFKNFVTFLALIFSDLSYLNHKVINSMSHDLDYFHRSAGSVAYIFLYELDFLKASHLLGTQGGAQFDHICPKFHIFKEQKLDQ